MKFEVKSVSDVIKLRQGGITEFSEVSINVGLIHGDLLKVCILWATLRLTTGGKVDFVGLECGGYGFGRKGLRQWQVEALLRQSFDQSIRVEESTASKISCFKYNAGKQDSGLISVAYVCSNTLAEAEKLWKSIKGAQELAVQSFVPVEFLVCFSQKDAVSDEFITWCDRLSIDVRLIYHDCKRDDDIYISEKKAELWNHSNGDIVVICHSRIEFDALFFSMLSKLEFQFCAPRVSLLASGKPYLDYVLLRSYNRFSVERRSPFLPNGSPLSYLRYLHNRWRPYVDGGVYIFNKRVIKFNPFTAVLNVPWGQAEDVVMADILSSRGVVIDYLYELRCFSSTSKFYFKTGVVGKLLAIKHKIRQYLAAFL